MPLIGLLIRQVININLFGKLIILKSSLNIAAIGFHKVKTARRPIFITSLADNSSNSVSSTLSTLFLTVLL